MTGISNLKKGAVVASAATIAASGNIFHCSGTAAIGTINPPSDMESSKITIIPDGAFTTVTGGNIAKASTGIVNLPMTLTWDGALWYPDY
jgi:hypothetical protein